jgi:hypothetical protein
LLLQGYEAAAEVARAGLKPGNLTATQQRTVWPILHGEVTDAQLCWLASCQSTICRCHSARKVLWSIESMLRGINTPLMLLLLLLLPPQHCAS